MWGVRFLFSTRLSSANLRDKRIELRKMLKRQVVALAKVGQFHFTDQETLQGVWGLDPATASEETEKLKVLLPSEKSIFNIFPNLIKYPIPYLNTLK